MARRQRITVLGSTGSIGVNTLDVIARHPDLFEVYALAAGQNVALMAQQCEQFRPQRVVMATEAAAVELQTVLKKKGQLPSIEFGSIAMESVASDLQTDAVMAAIVGAAGLRPCMAAARAGKRLLLANKEALVVGSDVFLKAVADGDATLLPIDSEHSAVFQSLPQDRSSWAARVDKIILTASGGPFRTRDPKTLFSVTPEEAVAHPNWVMGRKISVDSATMMNKALEVIEAKYLFGVTPEQIEVVIHPQSVIHSMVQFKDASVVAQLGTPDMRGPIAYGLSWPERIESGAARLDFSRMASLTFETADDSHFPGLALAWQSLKAPAGTTAVLNAANEVAVDAFLNHQLRFDHIHAVNSETLSTVLPSDVSTVEDLLDLDEQARRAARDVVESLR